MKTIKIIFATLLMLAAVSANAQKVVLKKNGVVVKKFAASAVQQVKFLPGEATGVVEANSATQNVTYSLADSPRLDVGNDKLTFTDNASSVDFSKDEMVRLSVKVDEQFVCYLQNVQTGKFIDQGNDYGTTISLGHGIDLLATKTNNGTYVFDTHILNADNNNHWLSVNGFVDADWSEYVVNDLGDGICTIKTLDGRALTAHEGNTAVGFEEENGAWSQWRMLSKEQMMANLQNTPADATWMIDDPNFSRNNTRVSSWKEDNGNTPVKGGEEYNFNAERWGGDTGTFDIYQQLTDIPNGVYELSVQGYYRYNETDDNNNDFAIAAHANGTEQIFAFAYANGAEVALPSVADDDAVRELGSAPLWTWEASAAFSKGLYTRKLFVEVTDGTLRVGIKKTKHTGCDWTVFDNFELTYLGAKESLKCGDNINWWFDAATSTLTFTGTGYMAGTREALNDFSTQIENIVIGEGILGTSWDSFVGCKNVASAKLPESLIHINGSTFNGCTKLASIDIPANVEGISPWAFAGTGISSVVLPKSVTNIGDHVFNGCWNLNDVTCLASEVPETNLEAFGDIDLSKATLHVPELSYTGYVATKPWSDFGNIVAIPAVVKELTDGEPYTNSELLSFDKITFTKTFSASAAGNWNALYVPMSINVEDYAGEFDIAEIYAFCATVDTNGDGVVDATDENFLFVYPVKTGCTVPNVPYLIRPREAKTYVINSADNVLYPATNGSVEFSTTRDRYTVTGLNESYTVVAGDNNYYVSTTGKLNIRTSGSTTVKPNRWIMHRESKVYGGGDTSAAKEYRIIAIGEDIDETNDINTINMSQDELTSGFYTIDGRKLNDSKNLPAGVYIKNGKKFVIK